MEYQKPGAAKVRIDFRCELAYLGEGAWKLKEMDIDGLGEDTWKVERLEFIEFNGR